MKVFVSSGAMHFTDELSYSEGYNAYCLCKALAAKGIQLTIMAPSVRVSEDIDGAETVGLGEFHTLRNTRYYVWEWLKYNLRLLVEAKRIIRETEPDLIHHIFPSWIDYGYSFYPILDMERPFVYGPILTQSSGAVSESASKKDSLLRILRKVVLRRLYVQTLRRASRVIVSVDDAFNYLPEFTRDKSTVICHGIDTETFTPSEESKDGRRFTVIFIGRLVPDKGASVAIRAVALARRRIPDVLLQIVGAGPQRPDLEALVRSEGLEDSVQFMGFVEDSRVPQLLKDSHLLCCPSLSDASPSVLLQGMSCGLPIVATKVAGIPGMVRHGQDGLLVKPDSPMELSDAFVSLFDDPELAKRMGANGRVSAETNFDWNVIAQRVIRTYRESLNRDVKS